MNSQRFVRMPVLAAEAQIYHRLLAMDQLEAQSIASKFLKGRPLVELYDSLLIPALTMADKTGTKEQLTQPGRSFSISPSTKWSSSFPSINWRTPHPLKIPRVYQMPRTIPTPG